MFFPAPYASDARWMHAVAERLRRQRKLKRSVQSLRRLRTLLVEQYLDIRTIGPRGHPDRLPSHFRDATFYEPMDYALLGDFLKPLQLTSDDVAVDIGCGMGRTLCVFARQRVRKCIGIELNPELAETARVNAQRLRGRKAPIEVYAGDAALADYTEGTAFWLFNPFGAQTLEAVLARIRESLREAPRRIRIAYAYPVHEEVLAASGWLTCTGRKHSALFSDFRSSYWSNQA